MFRKYISTFILAAIFFTLVIYIVIFPNEAFKAAHEGLLLWFNVVLPALLPFFICVEIIIGLGIVSFLGSCFKYVMRPVFNIPGEGAFAFFMSISSGYPVGAKITADLLENKICSRIEAQRMLSLCSTSGPLFIIGAVATGILNNSKLGLLLAASHYLSAISAGLLMGFWRDNKYRSKKAVNISLRHKAISPIAEMLEYRKKDGRSFGVLMGDAVKKSINLILMVGGFIIFFSVVAAILKASGVLGILSKGISLLFPLSELNTQAISGFIIGFLEVTNGIKEIALVNIPLGVKLILVSFMIGFGGLSINAQVLSVVASSRLNFGIYFIMKLFQGAAAAFYTYLLYGLGAVKEAFKTLDPASMNVYATYINSSFAYRLMDSAVSLLLVLTFLLLLAWTLHIKRAKA